MTFGSIHDYYLIHEDILPELKKLNILKLFREVKKMYDVKKIIHYDF